ncbi:hypothetical protein FNF28_00918 [Cafeteria roenbergensis]|uniref:Uncharacterized protein n=1 Tax=Cafeteria roenbergensis TaxID=33653 RepID=A0A5A8E5B2_CAFRO|nr:hypothetical protein FNF28_00918 [Cafeteria roenbergensis]
MRVVLAVLAALAAVASAAASTGLRGTSPLSMKDMEAVRFLRASSRAKEGEPSESAAQLTTCFREHVQMFDRGTANVIDACARITSIKCSKSSSAAEVTQCWREVARPICAGSVEGLADVQRVRLAQLRAAEQQRQASHRNKIAMRSMAGEETKALSPIDREYLKLDGKDPAKPESEVEDEAELDGNSETLSGDAPEDFDGDSTEEEEDEDSGEEEEEAEEEEEEEESGGEYHEGDAEAEASGEYNEEAAGEDGEGDSGEEGDEESEENSSEEEDANFMQTAARTQPKHGGKHGAKHAKQSTPHVGPDELESISQRWDDIKRAASGADLEKAKAARIRPGFKTSFLQTTASGPAVSVAILDALETTCSLRHYKGE